LQLRNVSDPLDPLNRFITPFPCIDKCLRLCPVFAALVIVDLEIVALGIERRIYVAKIDTLTWNFIFIT
jgi:hypothetical protein